MARELNEQWIEEIDGKKHMFKAVTPIINGHPDIKDLGMLNEDGCLPAPWDKALYPQVYRTTEALWYAYAESYGIFMEAIGKTKQEVIDTWNRRA